LHVVFMSLLNSVPLWALGANKNRAFSRLHWWAECRTRADQTLLYF